MNATKASKIARRYVERFYDEFDADVTDVRPASIDGADGYLARVRSGVSTFDVQIIGRAIHRVDCYGLHETAPTLPRPVYGDESTSAKEPK